MTSHTMQFEVIRDRLLWRIAANEMKNRWLDFRIEKADYGSYEYYKARREQAQLDGAFRGLMDAWDELSICHYGERT